MALVVPVFPVRSETFIVSKAAGLIAAGWDVHVVCQRRDDALMAELPAKTRELLEGRVHEGWPHRPKLLAAVLAPVAIAICFARRPMKTLGYLTRGGSMRKLYLDAQLVQLAPNIVHFEFGTLAVGRMHLGKALDSLTVVSFRGYDLNYIGLEDASYYEAVWREATLVHVLGRDLWDRALRRGCPTEKAHVLIPPAIDVEFFDPGDREVHSDVGTKERPLRLLSVGRLEWKKGYEYALEAVRALVDQGIRCEYRIIGAGEYYTATAYARYQLGLTDSVELLGAQPAERVREEMHWADVFLHSAVSEGFGNAVIEAQAMELPVVCTTADGLPENVQDRATGLVVPSRNAGALADAIGLLASDEGLRIRMGAAGRDRVLEKFQMVDQIAAFGRLYESMPERAALASSGVA